MSNVTSLDEWRKLKKQALKDNKDTSFEEFLKEWEDFESMYGPVSDTEEVSVYHSLVISDRTDSEFLELRDLLDSVGATYTVSSKPPEGNPFE